MKNPTIRHGDILLLPAPRPRDASPKHGLTLAEGEATGHAHVIQSTAPGDASLVEARGVTYLDARRTVALVHEEHARVEITRGCYRIVHQHEHTPSPYAPRAVARVRD